MSSKELSFVVIAGDICVPWDNISRLSWEDDRKLSIGFKTLAGADATTSWRLTDEQAYEFWENYTGQRFSADTRPKPDPLDDWKKSEQTRLQFKLSGETKE